jgi:uncharacterized protein (DUF1501 family)
MAMLCETPSLSRRALLLTSGATFAWAYVPKFARAADGRDPRLIVVILRGALDGLSTVGPIGDPDYAGLHGDLALAASSDRPALPLDGFFALNPAMPNFARMFKEGRACVVHATATAYRERSHFDGQDVLESGYKGPGPVDSGWLNRALAELPPGERVNRRSGLGVGAAMPLILRGSAPVLGWAPQILPTAGDDLAARVVDLYTHRDPMLRAALEQGLAIDKLALRDGMNGGAGARPRVGMDQPAGMQLAAKGAATLIAADDGPRIAAMAFEGWDTHANEGGATGQLALRLSGLDGALAEFEKGLGERWADTTLIAITEFGRTARINGTVGTDHGTATVALLAGGAVRGGRVIADWPGLKPSQLYEGRDLAPTTDLRSVLKAILADQFGLSATELGTKVFPDSLGVKSMQGLIA